MNLDALIEAIPSYAKDLKLNFSAWCGNRPN